MQAKKFLCITTVSTVLSGYLALTQTGTAQEKESDIFSNNINKTTDIQPLNSDDFELLSENSSTNQLDQTTDSLDQGFSLEDNSDSQEIVENSLEISQQSDSGITQKATSTEESLNQTTSTTSSAEIQNSSSESNQINKGTEDGWKYDIRGDYAYITSSNLSGDVSVPSTLGGKPIRFERLDGSVFVNYKNITSFKVSSLFYAEAVSFKGWSNLESVDLNLISIGNNSTKEMFKDLLKLKSINLNNFDTSNITDMSGMFYNCNLLSNLDVSKFNTSNVTDMTSMFYGCTSLTILDVSNFNTSNVTDMSGMFYSCSNLSTLDLSSFDTSSVSKMSFMFSLSGVNTLDLSHFNTSNVKNISYMFSWCLSLTSLNVSSWKTTNITDMSNLFTNSGLISLDLSNWDTSNVTDMSNMFNSCKSLSNLDLSNWNTSNVINMNTMFSYTGLASLNVSSFNTSKVTNMEDMFASNLNLTSLDLSNWNMSNVTTISGMFNNCISLNTLNVSNWDTSKVKNMRNLFWNTSITSLDLSNWNTSNVTTMFGLFSECSNLRSLDVSSWDTSKVKDMTSMFKNTSLTNLDISNWDTSNVTNMQGMFSDNLELISLEVPNWNTSNVTNMSGMFMLCPKFKKLNASYWDTSNVTNMGFMFTVQTTDPEQVLLVQTNDPKLLAYDYYSVDRRIPGGPRFNTDGGLFPDATDINKSYFSKVAMTTDEYKNKSTLSSLEEYVKNIEPTKEGSDFISWTNSSGKNIDEITNIFDEVDTTYIANWQRKNDPNIPDGSTLPDNVNPNSRLGIAYYPTKLSIPKTDLNESGEQNIPIQTTSIHVGVKDYYATTSWTLRAQIKWDKDDFRGSYIQSDNNGKVYKNENNGNDPFTDGDLKNTTEASGERSPIIDETESPIMSATNEKRTGVYDYSLGKLTLVIPETKYIEPNQYSGTIQWNLVSAP